MEQTTNEIKLDDKQVKAIKEELIKEITESGIEVINDDYRASDDIELMLIKFEHEYKKYNEKSKDIKETYAPKVAREKIEELEKNLKLKVEEIKKDLDRIIVKEKNYKEIVMRRLQDKSEYKKARREALDIILKVGDRLDLETTMTLVKPIAKGRDLTTLKILSTMKSKENSLAYTSAICEVERFTNTTETEKAIQSFKNYMNKPREGRTLDLMQYLHNNNFSLRSE
ncbi:hypothetical protein PN294_14870 [Romboutsia sp. 1001216sp1]|uniref:hypothetical protein n=1 Tax=unclassified Romboutsia TaxID=2626894 RepID=UPI00189C6F7C|nr:MULTISPECIES: hypothetical protein [unclassified Romboutsia]MDB8803446.1 hypothetical protein [Romboutsia sp. 1001216sp1]MDB8803455.1 hypothetical protein [Romboutsia sp. 1001216sp1]MDB8814836.1 hypothetical protein [Romboutsia sp. 1001216sp1]MDB8814845.1 hypothetical protein [Romboutsia sp. 1001216sp1]